MELKTESRDIHSQTMLEILRDARYMQARGGTDGDVVAHVVHSADMAICVLNDKITALQQRIDG